jgi:oligopeptide/dipeptide ABC transporter ATP-binding protein
MTMLAQSDRRRTAAEADVERFRLRRFLELVRDAGELEVVSEPLDLVDVASRLDGNPKAVLLHGVGRERAELVGNVLGSRRRLALAFGTTGRGLLGEILKRIEEPIPPVDVSSAGAPVHQIVLTGEDADFTRLPVHLQHSEDGAPYISASIDITQSFDGKRRNVGYRRLMLRGRTEAGMDLVAPSDLRAMYAEFVKHKERMPIAFAVGSHPTDSVAAVCTWTAADEVAIMYAGQIVEVGEAVDFFPAPLHPYSKMLMDSVPRLHSDSDPIFITGQPPSLISLPKGCRFAARCPFRFNKCDREPPQFVKDGRKVKCWLYA